MLVFQIVSWCFSVHVCVCVICDVTYVLAHKSIETNTVIIFIRSATLNFCTCFQNKSKFAWCFLHKRINAARSNNRIGEIGVEVLSLHMQQKLIFIFCKNHKPHIDENFPFYLKLPHSSSELQVSSRKTNEGDKQETQQKLQNAFGRVEKKNIHIYFNIRGEILLILPSWVQTSAVILQCFERSLGGLQS